MAASLEDKRRLQLAFEAAVRVIQTLPKEGPFTPSNETKLKFYAFFKQATEGPCTKSRPSLWDVVNRAKHDAWAKLGDMSRQEAMKGYIENLLKIIDTMSYTSEVSDFKATAGGFPDSAGAFSDFLELSRSETEERQAAGQDRDPEELPSPPSLWNGEDAGADVAVVDMAVVDSDEDVPYEDASMDMRMAAEGGASSSSTPGIGRPRPIRVKAAAGGGDIGDRLRDIQRDLARLATAVEGLSARSTKQRGEPGKELSSACSCPIPELLRRRLPPTVLLILLLLWPVLVNSGWAWLKRRLARRTGQ